MLGLACPICGFSDSKVLRTNKSASAIRRDRRCKNPAGHHDFTTEETCLIGDYLVSRPGNLIHPFDHKKLYLSIKNAGGGLLSDAAVTQVTERVQAHLDMRPREPIPTYRIGESVIRELRQVSINCALRYAISFYTRQGEMSTAREFAAWALDKVGVANESSGTADRPAWVVKKSRIKTDNNRREGFHLPKMWRGVDNAVSGLLPTSLKERGWTHEEFVGTLIARVLSDLEGQSLVTSGQLSGSVLEVLRANCELGFIRFSVIAKGYNGAADFLGDSAGLDSHPSHPHDLEGFRERGAELATEARSWFGQLSSTPEP